MWTVFKLTSHFIQNTKPSLGYFTDNSNVLKNTTLTIQLLYTITKHLKRELHWWSPPFLCPIRDGLQMEHFRGPTKTFVWICDTCFVCGAQRERLCGGNGSIFRLFIPGFWGPSSLKILKLLCYLHSSNVFSKKIVNFFVCVPQNYFGDKIKLHWWQFFPRPFTWGNRALSNKCKTYYLSSEKPFKCKVKPRSFRSHPTALPSLKTCTHDLFINNTMGMMEEMAKQLLKFAKNRMPTIAGVCKAASLACKVT